MALKACEMNKRENERENLYNLDLFFFLLRLVCCVVCGGYAPDAGACCSCQT